MVTKIRSSFKKNQVMVLAAVLIVLSGAAVFAGGNAEQERASLNQRKPAVSNRDLVIPITDIHDSVDFYPVEIDGLQMEIMVVKAPDGSIRTAFNVCHYCYQRVDDPRVLGYFVQVKGPQLISTCGSERIFTMDKIQNSFDTCHPEPIPAENRTVTSSTVTITRDYFDRAKAMFADMKFMDEVASCCQ